MKRCLTKLVLFLILGATVNVTAAWGMRFWSELHRQGSTVVSLDDVPGELLPEFRWTATSGPWYARIRLAGTGLDESWFVWTNAAGELPSLDPWDSMSARTWTSHRRVSASMLEQWRQGLAYHVSLVEVRIGWPGRSFVGRHSVNPVQMPTTYEGAIRLPDSLIQLTRGKSRFDLPIKPIWSGFAINTIFYGAILWLLSLGPSATRRLIRRKRGRCINCGYDLRGASWGASGGGGVCPECGAGGDGV